MLHKIFLHRKKKVNPVPPIPPIIYNGTVDYRSTQTTIYDYYGRVVALNDAGTRFFVGSDENSNSNLPNITAGPGRVYMYSKIAGVWSSSPTSIITASDGKINDSFGQSIDVSADGNILVVGAPNASIGGNAKQGAVYVFQWNSTSNSWAQTHKLTDPTGTAEDYFGYSVSVSRDGTTIAAGSNKDDIIPGYIVGSVNVYSAVTLITGVANISGNTLTVTSSAVVTGIIGLGSVVTGPNIPANTKIEGFITGTGGIGSYRISWNSTSALTGVPITVSTTWSTPSKLISSNPKPDDYFGCSIALSTSGEHIVIGSSGSDVGSVPNSGSVYYYRRESIGGSIYYIQSSIVSSSVSVPGQSFGFSVDLDSTGTAMLVGAPLYETGISDEDVGCAYLFKLVNGVWIQKLQIKSADGESKDRFGWDVSIGTEGRYLCIGAPGCEIGLNNEAGAAYIYVNLGTGWVQTAKLDETYFAAAETGDQFGYSVAITPDGKTAAMGAPTKGAPTGLPEPNTTRIRGAAYVFSQ